jgi:hypothetical protein
MNENIQDAKLFERAMKQRWKLDDSYKEVIIRKLMKIVMADDATKREVISASRALITAEGQNQADEHSAAVQSDRNRFLEIARRLGVDANFRLIAEEPANPSVSGFDGTEYGWPRAGQ